MRQDSHLFPQNLKFKGGFQVPRVELLIPELESSILHVFFATSCFTENPDDVFSKPQPSSRPGPPFSAPFLAVFYLGSTLLLLSNTFNFRLITLLWMID